MDGTVHAADLTHGPYWGSADLDCGPLVAAIIARKDPRIRYMIFQRRIISGNHGPAPWQWRPYSGVSPHLEHVHISINYDSASENDTSPWFSHAIKPGGLSSPGEDPTQEDDMTPDQDAKLTEVLKRLQTLPVDVWTQRIDGPGGVHQQPAAAVLATAMSGALGAAASSDPGAIADHLADNLGPDLAKQVMQALAAKLGQ